MYGALGNVAKVVFFLASEASDFITGEVIVADAGY